MKIFCVSIIALLCGLVSSNKCHNCQSTERNQCPPTAPLIDCGSKGCISIDSVPVNQEPSCKSRRAKTVGFYFRGCLDPEEISQKLSKGDDGMKTLNEYCYQDGCNTFNYERNFETENKIA